MDNLSKIKSRILANLDYLPSKVERFDTDSFVTLNSKYDCECGTTFFLSITAFVKAKAGGVNITGFEIQTVDFFKSNGDNAGFSFTKEELTDYIDF